jgi:hypothetical protein
MLVICSSYFCRPVNSLILLFIAKFVFKENLFPTRYLPPLPTGTYPALDAPKVLFVMAFAAIMFGCINGAREIVKEAAIYRRERAVNLGIMPYMLSKIVVLGALCLLQSAVIVLTINAVQPFQNSIVLPGVLEIYITIALTSIAGLMMGLAISALAPNSDRAMSFIPIILIPQVIFAGYTFPLTSVPFQVVGFLFIARWAMVALGSTVGLPPPPTADKLINNVNPFNHTTDFLLLSWLVLAVMIVLLGLAIAYFLKRKDVRA